MQIKRIGYQHSFQVSQFLFDKIYFEAELEPNDTEEQVINTLIQKCKEVAQRVSEGVNGNDANRAIALFENLAADRIPIYDPILPTPIEESIRQCKSIKELELYEKIIDKTKDAEEKRKLWIVYDDKYGQLKGQSA